MNWLLGSDRCLATAVLSNLGPQLGELPVPYRHGRACIGGLQLEQVELLPPVRRHTRAALGVVTYAGELTLSLHYDAACLNSEAAADFFAGYVSAIKTAASASASEPARRPATVRVPARAASPLDGNRCCLMRRLPKGEASSKLAACHRFQRSASSAPVRRV